MFLDPLLVLISGATTERYEYIEASTPEELSRRFIALVASIVAENAARVTAQLDPFNIYDMDIAGGGDGHTFIVKLLLSTWDPPESQFIARWASTGIAGASTLQATFWLAGTEQELRIAASAALATFASGSEATEINVGMAGAAKGTRFMGFIAGLKR
jgi:hypothetical protein